MEPNFRKSEDEYEDIFSSSESDKSFSGLILDSKTLRSLNDPAFFDYAESYIEYAKRIKKEQDSEKYLEVTQQLKVIQEEIARREQIKKKSNSSQKIKTKKKKNVLIIVLLIILGVLALALIIGIIGAVTGTSGDDSTSNVSITVFDKENAEALDTSISGMTEAAEKFYDDLVNEMSQLEAGTVTAVDIYDEAVSAQENIQKLRTQIKEKSNTLCADYVEASSQHLANCWAYANYIQKYMENQSQSDLEKAKETAQLIPVSALEYESAREIFLRSAGYSDSEIEAMK